MDLKVYYLIIAVVISCSCQQATNKKVSEQQTASKNVPIQHTQLAFAYDSVYIAKAFDFPVGKPNAKGYYNAQPFKENNHLGDDWNAVTGGNTDLGDPVYAIANGYVKAARDYRGGWGNVIRILHKMPNGKVVESLYAHCDTIVVQPNQYVTKGTKIGTIGTANGQYLAHLHFEMRDNIQLPLGPGYATETTGYINPTAFIKENR